MAYVSQELKAALAPKIRSICKKHGIKASVAVKNHRTLVLNISAGSIDFHGDMAGGAGRTGHIQVNPHWYQSHFTGKALDFLSEVIPAMNHGNHDNSDIQSDYFDVGWYISVNVGKWDKPYTLTN